MATPKVRAYGAVLRSGSNQAGPANSAGSPVAVVLSSSMAWSPPALERRSWLVEQAGDYATPVSHHIRAGTERDRPAFIFVRAAM